MRARVCVCLLETMLLQPYLSHGLVLSMVFKAFCAILENTGAFPSPNILPVWKTQAKHATGFSRTVNTNTVGSLIGLVGNQAGKRFGWSQDWLGFFFNGIVGILVGIARGCCSMFARLGVAIGPAGILVSWMSTMCTALQPFC